MTSEPLNRFRETLCIDNRTLPPDPSHAFWVRPCSLEMRHLATRTAGRHSGTSDMKYDCGKAQAGGERCPGVAPRSHVDTVMYDAQIARRLARFTIAAHYTPAVRRGKQARTEPAR